MRQRVLVRNRARVKPLADRIKKQRHQRGYVHGTIKYMQEGSGSVKYIWSSKARMWVDAISAAMGFGTVFGFGEETLWGIRHELERANQPLSEAGEKAVDAAFAVFCEAQYNDSVFRQAHEDLFDKMKEGNNQGSMFLSEEELKALFGSYLVK